MADRVAFMAGDAIVEQGPREVVLLNLSHPRVPLPQPLYPE
jgi:ABC-type dipeptide/oligopeptide/nickel transport system ATPase component